MRRRRLRSDILISTTLVYFGVLMLVFGSIGYFEFSEIIAGIGQASLTAGLVGVVSSLLRRRQGEGDQAAEILPVLNVNKIAARERLRDALQRSRRVRIALESGEGQQSVVVSILVEMVETGMLRPDEIAVVIGDPSARDSGTDAADSEARLASLLASHGIPVRLAAQVVTATTILTEEVIYLGAPTIVTAGKGQRGLPLILEIARYSELGQAVEHSFGDLWASSRETQ